MHDTTADADDSQLMQRYRSGDARAFELLYRRHEGALFRFVLRQLHDRSAAGDLAQEIWFAVARAAERYREQERFRAWLFTLARHRIIDHVRAQDSRTRFEQPADAALLNSVSTDPSPERELDAAQTLSRLLGAVGALPFEQREAFLLLAEGECSIEEIARITQVNAETVKSRLRYARQKLRAQLPEPA